MHVYIYINLYVYMCIIAFIEHLLNIRCQALWYMCVCVYMHSVVSDSCDPVDCSPPGTSVHGIFQARILEWVAISSSRDSS